MDFQLIQNQQDRFLRNSHVMESKRTFLLVAAAAFGALISPLTKDKVALIARQQICDDFLFIVPINMGRIASTVGAGRIVFLVMRSRQVDG